MGHVPRRPVVLRTGVFDVLNEQGNPLVGPTTSRKSVAMSFEWLGQTMASACWIVSVFVYGISSTGDWLQLGAASCWMVANLATLAGAEA